MDLKAFYRECVKRKVFKGISIYAISSWVIIQVVATTFPHLGFPQEAITTVIILILVGFPISIIFSWYYNIIPEKESDLPKVKVKARGENPNKTFFSFIGLLSVVIIIVSVLIFKRMDRTTPVQINTGAIDDQIVVLKFNNNTQDESLDIIGKMASDWISNGIVQNSIAPVLNYGTIESLNAITNNSIKNASLMTSLQSITSFSKLIVGSFYIVGNELIIQSSLEDRETGKQVAFEDVKCVKSEPLRGIEVVKQQILTHFLGEREKLISDKLPLYDAYKEFLQAKENWTSNPSRAMTFLDNALSLDPDFYLASYYKVNLLYNNGDIALADSLTREFLMNTRLTQQEYDLFQYFSYIISGQNGNAYQAFKKIYQKEPSNIFDNVDMMLLTTFYVNKAEEIPLLYEIIKEEKIDYEKCTFCASRIVYKAISDIHFGKYKEAVDILESHLEYYPRSAYILWLLKAYVLHNDITKIEAFTNSLIYKSLDNKPYYLMILAREFSLAGNKEMARKYTDLTIEASELDNLSDIRMGRLFYNIGDLDKAFDHFYRVNKENANAYSMSRMAAIHFMNDEDQKGEELIQKLEDLLKLPEYKYDKGRNEYLRAAAYVHKGDYNKMYRLLELSLQKGKLYDFFSFDNDINFISIKDTPDFKNILQYWHDSQPLKN